MLTNNQLIYVLQLLCPEITQADLGVTYWVGAPVDGTGQTDDAFIVAWQFDDIEQPSQEDINAKWKAVKGDYEEDTKPGPKTQFSVREFRDRFTREEQIAIRQSSMTDMEVGLVYDDFQSAQFIDLSDPAVAQGIDLYVDRGLLEPDRKAELLTPEAA